MITPTKFDEANRNLAKPNGMTDEECNSLWVFTDGSQCVSRWKLSWKDRLRILRTGTIWLGILSGYSQPPVWLEAKPVFRSDVRKKKKKGDHRCRACGCTDASACPGGCYWVEGDLCSTCAAEQEGGMYD